MNGRLWPVVLREVSVPAAPLSDDEDYVIDGPFAETKEMLIGIASMRREGAPQS